MQRQILNSLNIDFKRDNQSQSEYIDKKIEQIIKYIKAYAEYAHVRGYILGLSGGIDSFAAGALIAQTGARLHLLMLPCGVQQDIDDARECAQVLSKYPNVTVETINIQHAYEGVQKDLESSQLFDSTNVYALGNTQARLRMVVQYALSSGLLVAGTDHAAENCVGYFTKYGDGGIDFNPLDGLLKQDIYEISKRFGAPGCVLRKPPAAGLGISDADETELKIGYEDICKYLSGYKMDSQISDRIEHLYKVAEHKRRPIPSPMNTWFEQSSQEFTHVVVDCTYAFIGGALACQNSQNCVKNNIDYINKHENMRVLYVRDVHPEDHCSFIEQGGLWPPHAVQGTKEACIHQDYYTIAKTINTPIERYNVFDKGFEKHEEQYSGYWAQNKYHGLLKDNLTHKVVISGIATEYCVKQTVLDLLGAGHEVYLLAEGLAYVDKMGHEQTLKELHDKVTII